MIKSIVNDLREESYQLYHNITTTRSLYNARDVRAHISEQSVMNILINYGFSQLNKFPKTNGHEWVRDNRGIYVNKNSDKLHEFDEIGTIKNQAIVLEVKSAKLNGFASKISRALDLANEAFPEQKPALLVFFPFRYNKTKQITTIENIENVYCIDTAWSRKSIGDAVNKYYISHQY